MKKGQAALEFLTTYGWAFMVILVMIGALAYFGVLNPQKYLPEKCLITTGLDCTDHQITKTGTLAKVRITNNLGSTISSITMSSTSCGADTDTEVDVPTGTSFEMECTITATLPATGDKFRMPLNFNYTVAGKAYPKIASGELFATVQ
jgi:hypothetical protein